MRAAALLLLLAAAPAAAQSVQKGHADSQETPPPGVFGPFDKLRKKAAKAGITLAARYTSELGFNADGGRAHRVTETGQADLSAKFDLEKLAGVKGGTVNAVLTWRRGDLLDQIAGLNTLQQSQEIYGRGQAVRLTRFWYEQRFGKARLKLGRSNVGEDFASFSCDFMNLSFCGAQPGNLVGDYWFNWPVSQWMGRLRYDLGGGYLQAGAYEVNPRNLKNKFALGYFGGATGVLLPIEAVWQPRLHGLPGIYRVGAWYDTSRGDDAVLDRAGGIAALSGLAPLEHDGRFGAWLVARQQVTGTADEHGTLKGLTLFARVTQADRRTARLDDQVTVGLFYEGLSSVAPDDAIGLAIGRTHVNGRIGAAEAASGRPIAGSEYEGELFYSLHPLGGIVLRPNFQYIIHPGGRADARDAVVLGLKTAINL